MLAFPNWLDDLATAMARRSLVSRIHAGYTYLGQMISHDIVPNSSAIEASRVVSSELSLNSLYGAVRTHTDYFDGHGRFRTAAHDLYRTDSGVAIIPEQRNDGNIITAQLHRFWQQIHNIAIALDPGDKFAGARETTVKLFQLIVIEDYLKQILHPPVYEQYFVHNQPRLHLLREVMPPVFTQAAFRFGHSMVRGHYRLSDESPEHFIEDLFLPSRPIAPDLAIDWRLFFGVTGDGAAQRANRIDTLIEPGMEQIDRPHSIVNIIRRNLERGFEAGLPTGTQYANQLLAAEPSLAIGLGLRPLPILSGNLRRVSGLAIDELPLWPYILLEAATTNRGERLGPLGSLVCADVLYTAIRDATPTVFSAGGEYEPGAPFRLPAGMTRQLDALIQRFPASGRICMRHLVELYASAERAPA
ncbi:MAG: hypothetical protein KDI19_15715 [Pseudomonadales bacterium]|nr:hypothetical protein [Pseudomonadales bacterium]